MLNWGERGHVLATCDTDVVYCRVIGIANMNNSAPFEEFTRSTQERGYREFVLDFSSCEALDSTFLGIVLGLKLGRAGGDERRAQVTAINVSAPVLRVLAEVGIDRLIEILPQPVTLPQIPMRRLERDCSEEERLDMILSAHQLLCELGEENRERFGAFVALMRDELARGARRAKRKQRAPTGEAGEG